MSLLPLVKPRTEAVSLTAMLNVGSAESVLLLRLLINCPQAAGGISRQTRAAMVAVATARVKSVLMLALFFNGTSSLDFNLRFYVP